MMSLFWIMIFVLGFCGRHSECKIQRKFPSAVVIGSVYCHACLHRVFPKATTGASVAVECSDRTRSSPSFSQEVKTDKHGEFKVYLPFSESKKANKIRGCSVKLISSNKPECAMAISASLHLKSREKGTRIFTSNQPRECDQKPQVESYKKENDEDKKSSTLNPDDPTFLPQIEDPPYNPPGIGKFLPPLRKLPPLPGLPRLPPAPGVPQLPLVPKSVPAKKPFTFLNEEVNHPTSVPSMLNPFNPPSIFPPNPFQSPSNVPPVFPDPPATNFPPFFATPRPSPPTFNLPTLPGFTTPSPQLPTSSSPISFPPFPFQPTPGFPVSPPADDSSIP